MGDITKKISIQYADFLAESKNLHSVELSANLAMLHVPSENWSVMLSALDNTSEPPETTKITFTLPCGRKFPCNIRDIINMENRQNTKKEASGADGILPIVLDALFCAKNTIIAFHGPDALDIYLSKSPEMKIINNAIDLCQEKLHS